MSWVSKINNNVFSIKTGDGKEYFPLFKTGESSLSFNTSVFEFINVAGSRIERKKRKSQNYPLLFWFQGENCLDQANALFLSSNDSRSWTVNHPIYGLITGDPMSISRKDNDFNIVEISVDFIENIPYSYPKSSFSVKDNSVAKKNEILESGALSYSNSNAISVQDIEKNKQSVKLIDSSFKDLQNDTTYADYSNAVSLADNSQNNLIDDTLTAIQRTQAIIDLPSSYSNPVLNRVKSFVRCYENFKRQLNTLSDKYFFESASGSVIASLCTTTFNIVDGDYQTYNDVQFSLNSITSVYNDYLTVIDNLSTSNYLSPNNYQSNPILQLQLNELVCYTIDNLFTLVFEAKQERVIYTNKTTNVILLAHRLIGLDKNDENLLNFIKINDIKLNRLFEIPINTPIKYYV